VTFESILFEKCENNADEAHLAPDFFADLNLELIVNAVTARREEYNLKPLFYTPVTDAATVKYRQQVMKEIEHDAVMEATVSFSEKMRKVRSNLKFYDRLNYKNNKDGVFLDTVELYCDAVSRYMEIITPLELKSDGFISFREYLTEYTQSSNFKALQKETESMRTELSNVRFCMLIKTGQVIVRRDESDDDYSMDVTGTFEKFRQGAVKSYRKTFFDHPGMNHVEAEVVNMVAKLFPETFQRLDKYCTKFASFLDKTIVKFDREVQFYVAYLQYITLFKSAGFHFCYPEISDSNKNVYSVEGYDMALGAKLILEKKELVCNDFRLEGSERIFVVTGPNQGGKTTFARTFGQLHFLASLGCPVPGREAKLLLFDRLFTHFERDEDINNLKGNLENDLTGIHAILEQASPRSVIIINEMFSSTTVHDGVVLGRRILGRIADMDTLCVYVTFLDELSSMNKTVSLVSTVETEKPEIRTFKIVRRKADGLSYALAIAKKHGLTYDILRERMRL
jgi:DNA mismatch repair ATPase MutS